MKKILALLLVAVLALTMIACKKDETGTNGQNDDAVLSEELIYENFKYSVNDDGNYEITGYVFGGVELLDITVPDDIEGRPITGIAADAFKGAKNIKSIVLPASLEYIGDYAFYDCDYITAVELPDSVISVGVGAFQSCDTLADVTFSKNLLLISDFAFKDCIALTDFALPEGLISIGIGSFDGCKAITAVTLPSSVVRLGDTAFYGCSNLASVTANVTVSETDTAILAKMNAALEAYETENGEAPKTASDAFAVLETAGLYVGGVDENGGKYIWDKEAKEIIGAFGAADAALIEKMNAALEKSTPEDKYKLNDLLTAAGLNLDHLNSAIENSKYSWNAQTNRMEVTYTIGANVFHGAKDNFTVYTNANSPVAVYAQAFHTVAPIPAE